MKLAERVLLELSSISDLGLNPLAGVSTCKCKDKKLCKCKEIQEAMHFKSPLFHSSSSKNLTKNMIEPFFHIGSIESARERSALTGGKYLYTIDIDRSKAIKVEDSPDNAQAIADVLLTYKLISKEEKEEVEQAFKDEDFPMLEGTYSTKSGKLLASMLKRNNIKLLSYKNDLEDVGELSYIIIDPKIIKSMRLVN